MFIQYIDCIKYVLIQFKIDKIYCSKFILQKVCTYLLKVIVKIHVQQI